MMWSLVKSEPALKWVDVVIWATRVFSLARWASRKGISFLPVALNRHNVQKEITEYISLYEKKNFFSVPKKYTFSPL